MSAELFAARIPCRGADRGHSMQAAAATPVPAATIRSPADLSIPLSIRFPWRRTRSAPPPAQDTARRGCGRLCPASRGLWPCNAASEPVAERGAMAGIRRSSRGTQPTNAKGSRSRRIGERGPPGLARATRSLHLGCISVPPVRSRQNDARRHRAPAGAFLLCQSIARPAPHLAVSIDAQPSPTPPAREAAPPDGPPIPVRPTSWGLRVQGQISAPEPERIRSQGPARLVP